jgi:transcriptional regulator with XRE-family HTH domain
MSWDGAKLRTLTQERGLTLIKLADLLNVSRQTVNDWIKGQVPKGSHLIKLSTTLDINPGYFFPNEVSEQISVPMHRKRGVAKVTPTMEQDSKQMAKEYENLFRFAPSPGLVPILRINKRDEKSAIEMASQLRRLANIEADKPMDYKHCFNLLSNLKIIIIFCYFPNSVKGYAFYCKIYNHRVVFVDNDTNVLDLIFPLLHETIHAIRDENGIVSYDKEEEDFCDSVASDVQFPNEYVQLVYKTIYGRPKSHQINLLKDFSVENGHSIFGIAEQLKKLYPSFDLDVAGANANLKKEFPIVGDILFEDEDPKCYIQNLKNLTPLFFDIVSNQISNVTTRKIGEWLCLESSLDAKEVLDEWRRMIN